MLVGAFVLALGASLVAAIVWLSAASGDKDYATYLTYIHESVSGLGLNATVSYNGVQVGSVTDIDLDPNDPSRVRVEMAIEVGTPVKTDTIAKLASSGITGVAHIELGGGSAESPLLAPTREHPEPVIESVPSLFVRLDSSITTLVDRLTGAAASLTEVADRVEMILSEENQQAITATLASVESFTAKLDDLASQVSEATANATEASRGLPDVVAAAERTLERFEQSGVAVEVAATDVSSASDALEVAVTTVADNANRTLVDLTPLTRGVPSRLVYLVDDLQRLAGSLRRVSEGIEEHPESLIFGRRNVVQGPGE